MIQYNYHIGIVLMVLNLIILILCLMGIYSRFNSAIKSENVKEADQHFILLLCFMIFLIGNSFAFYTGYKTYILNPGSVKNDIILYRLSDRTCMLLVAALLTWSGRIISELKK